MLFLPTDQGSNRILPKRGWQDVCVQHSTLPRQGLFRGVTNISKGDFEKPVATMLAAGMVNYADKYFYVFGGFEVCAATDNVNINTQPLQCLVNNWSIYSPTNRVYRYDLGAFSL